VTTEELQPLRRHAFAVAYRMLGSVADAEDVVQEALLRLTREEGPVREPAAWITTVTTRLAIDHLRLARVQRERYVGPWLPEPLLGDPAPGPDEHAELADTVSQAFLVLMEQLTPLERAAFLLRETFGYEYDRVAAVLGRSEASSRQLVSRARRHLDEHRPRFDADREAAQALLERFLAAAEEGDLEALEEMLAADVVVYGDGGGKAIAARRPVVGAARVARFMAGIARRRREVGEFDLELVTVNGHPGRVLRTSGGDVWDVLSIDVLDGRIQAVRIVRNPDKLAHVTGRAAHPSEGT
jgi:RNA polymerase sigma-70 factor (ECF subfamily)